MLSSDNAFRGICFVTHDFGETAIGMLKAFAPPSIHDALRAQRGRLEEIHDTGKMPFLGTTGPYRWVLAVWSRPSFEVALMAWPANFGFMSVAEALRIEQEATRRANLTARKFVSTRPYDIPHNRFGERIWENIKNGRHWSHGLV